MEKHIFRQDPPLSSFETKLALCFDKQSHTDVISAYREEKNALNIFWHSVPERSLPWENTL